MHWIHRQRQGWVVIGLGAALMGCGAPADQGGGFAAEPPAAGELALPAAQRLTFADAVALQPLRSAVDAMPLLAGGNVSGMPVARPEEQAAAMPGAAARLKK